MQAPTLLLILGGFAVVAVALGVAVRLGQRFGGDVDPVRGRGARPWWGRPGLWILVSAASALLGLFVFPKLFGFTFILLPFLWVGGLSRRRPRRDEEPGASPAEDAR